MITSIIAKGIFSKLEISLLPEVKNELTLISVKNNPLAKVESKLKAILAEFEQAYFEATKQGADNEHS